MHIKQRSFVILALLSVSSPSLALEILDYKPNCIAQKYAAVEVSKEFIMPFGFADPVLETSEFKQTLEILKQTSVPKQAEYLILEDVEKNITHVHRVKNKTTKLKIKLVSQPVKLCEDDKSLSDARLRFASDGYRMVKQTIAYTLPTPTSEPEKVVIPVVSSQQAFGIELGMSQQQVNTILGTPNLSTPVDNPTVWWSYGRNLWIAFKQGSVIEVTSKAPYFSAYTTNLIEYRAQFDDLIWTVNNLVTGDTELAAALLALPDAKRVNNNQIELNANAGTLTLSFDAFHPVSKEQDVYKLKHFSLAATNNHIPAAKITTLSTQNLNELLNIIESAGPLTYTEARAKFPENATIYQSNDRRIYITGHFTELHFKGQDLTAITFSSDLATHSTIDDVHSFLAKMGLAIQKDSLINSNQDAEDYFDTVEINTAIYQLTAKFDSSDDQAMLYQAQFKFME